MCFKKNTTLTFLSAVESFKWSLLWYNNTHKPFSEGKKKSYMLAKPCIYYLGTPDTARINHIQFVVSVFCCCQLRSRSLVSCQQCLRFLLQRNVTATPQAQAMWNTWVTHAATKQDNLGFITGAIIK